MRMPSREEGHEPCLGGVEFLHRRAVVAMLDAAVDRRIDQVLELPLVVHQVFALRPPLRSLPVERLPDMIGRGVAGGIFHRVSVLTSSGCARCGKFLVV